LRFVVVVAAAGEVTVDLVGVALVEIRHMEADLDGEHMNIAKTLVELYSALRLAQDRKGTHLDDPLGIDLQRLA
jgi:aspartokinase